MAKVDSFSFGSIVLDGKKYNRDVFLYPDGNIKKRKGGFWKFGSHAIKKEEMEELIKSGPDVLIVGTGTDSKAELTSDAKSYLQESKVESVITSSGEAVEKYNQLVAEGRRPAALIHITC
jgi:hypothetical protein